MNDAELDALLDLVEDSLAWALALSDDGGDAVPVDPEARPEATEPRPASAPRPAFSAPPPRAPMPAAPPPPAVSRPEARRPDPAPRPAPPALEPARAAPPAAASAPASGGIFAPSAPAAGGGLFGVPEKWATWREDPVEKLQKARAERPATCVDCGRPAFAIVGAPGPRLLVLAAPMAGEADQMFERMLVKVLRHERSDVLMAEARRCGTCAEHLRAEVRAYRPALVLAMGDVARSLVGAAVGTWSSWEETGALGTHHPDDLLARPDDKRAALAHLQELERRL